MECDEGAHGRSSSMVLLYHRGKPIMTEYQFCKVEDEGKIRIVTLNRPEVMNALHSDAHQELEKVWDEFAARDDLWIGIVTGAGERAFSAGNDLKVTAAG